MAKAFAAEEGTGLLLTSLGAEALIPGIGEVMMGVEMALFTAVKVGKMIKHHHENKVERRQQKSDNDEAERMAELERQMNAEHDAEEERMRQIEEAKEAKLKEEEDAKKKEEDEKLAKETKEKAEKDAIDAAYQQRAVEDQQDINRVINRDTYIMDQMERQRKQRIYENNQIPPGMEQSPSAADYIFGGSMGQGTYEPPNNVQYDPLNEHGDDWEDDYPINNNPGGGGGGPNGGGGGGNGGPGGPGGNNDNGELNVPDHRQRDFNQSTNGRNPYEELIKELARQIRENANKEKEKPKPQPIDDNTKQDVIPVQPSDDPNSNYPGKNGAGTRKYYDENGNEIAPPQQENPLPQNYNDELHLMENELLAILSAQGSAELTNEETLSELNRIEKAIPQSVQVNPSAVYSSQIAQF